MPRATIDLTETSRHDLKSVPGGYVVVRRLSYGKYLDRQTEAMDVKARAQRGEDMSMELKMMGRKTTAIEFRECIVEHNLTDENDLPLDLSFPGTLDRLDSRVGQELDDILKELNTFEGELGKSSTTSSGSSTDSRPNEETPVSS